MIDNPMNSISARRGSELSWSKLTEDDVRLIRETIEHREDLKRQAKAISNGKLAEKFDVHQRTIEKVCQGYTWGHVA